MGFHFPVSLHQMTAEERTDLDEHIKSLKIEAKSISNKSDDEIYEYSDLTLINFILRRYSAIIFGNMMDTKGRIKPIVNQLSIDHNIASNDNELLESSPIMKILKDQFAPFVFSMKTMDRGTCYNRQLAKYRKIRYSRLGEGFITLIGSYMTKVTWVSPETNKNDINFLATHGFILLNTLNAWIDQEIHLIHETVEYVHKKSEAIVKNDIIAKSRESRLKKNIALYETIVAKFNELRVLNPKISKDAASRILEEDKDIPFTARVIAKHLPKI